MQANDVAVNIGLSNDLVPSGTKALHEPMLTHIYVAIWGHQAECLALKPFT